MFVMASLVLTTAFAEFPESYVSVDEDMVISGLPESFDEACYSGNGTLTITGPHPINAVSTANVTFDCPVVFAAPDAVITLRNGQVNFLKPVVFNNLKSEVKKISVQNSATFTGGKLEIIGLDTLNSDVTTTSLVVENGTAEQHNRFAGLNELRTKGPVKVRFTGAGGTAGNTVDRIAKWTFGNWRTHIELNGNMTLTIGSASAEPGGYMSRTIESGSFLKSEESMVNGIWKPWTDITGKGVMSGVDADGNVIDVTPAAWLSGSGNDPSVIYRQQNSTITLAGNTEISAYRATGWVNINLNGHDLVVGSGIFGTGMEYQDVKVYDNVGGGRLVFGAQDIFMNFQNNKPVISAPMAWRRPEGNTSVGPSLFIMGNHWSSFQFTGDDEIGDYNNIFVGNDENQETVFGGSGDRTIHGALVGTSPIRKEGSGTLRIAGAHYPLNSNTMNVNSGRVVFEKNDSRYYTVNVKSGAVLEIGSQFDASINGLSISDGGTLAGSGRVSSKFRNLNNGSWLSPGSENELGTLRITAADVDARFYFNSGAGFKIKVSETESDCVNLCAGWHYLTMPGSDGVFNLELTPLSEGLTFNPSHEYMIFLSSGSDNYGGRITNKTAFRWNITTAAPKVLDVSKAKVEYRNCAYWLSGIRNLRKGICVFVR